MRIAELGRAVRPGPLSRALPRRDWIFLPDGSFANYAEPRSPGS